jgi:hypothetical protein
MLRGEHSMDVVGTALLLLPLVLGLGGAALAARLDSHGSGWAWVAVGVPLLLLGLALCLAALLWVDPIRPYWSELEVFMQIRWMEDGLSLIGGSHGTWAESGSTVLTVEEREALRRLVRRRAASQAAVMRARIVLAADAEPDAANMAIAARLSVSRQSVITWRQRFLEHRLDGLVDAPRSGTPRRVSDEAVEAMITRTLETGLASV